MQSFVVNTLWCDEHYYFDSASQQFKRKYFLVLAISPDKDDAITVVLTSRPNGLREIPACDLGPPRAGFFLGVPGGTLQKDSWLDFSSLRVADRREFFNHCAAKRITPIAWESQKVALADVLACLLRWDDLVGRHAKWIRHTLSML